LALGSARFVRFSEQTLTGNALRYLSQPVLAHLLINHGAGEAWLDFFLAGVADTANQAFDAATRIVETFKADRERIAAESERAGSALRIHDLFQQYPYFTANLLVERTGLSAPTVNAALADLERLGVVEEVTGRRRGRVFGYRRYLAILSEGTDPLPAAT
jgi:Fic family protein